MQELTTGAGAVPTIGIITTWIDSAYWTSVLSGASEALTAAGASIVCFTLGYSDSVGPEHRRGERDPFFALASADSVDGLIVPTPASFGVGAEAFFAARIGLPMVSVGATIPSVPSVVVDNVSGTRALLHHLIDDCGLRRIAYVRGIETNSEAQARFGAYVAVLAERGITLDESLVTNGDWLEASGARAAARLLGEGRPRPDAIVAANDLMALGVLRAVRERGLVVPQDIAVAGFDDIEAIQGVPALTTVRQPAVELGRAAAGMVLGQLRGQSVDEVVSYPTELVVRDSTPVATPRARARAVAPNESASAPRGTRFLELGHSPPAVTASAKLIRLLREEVFPHLHANPAVRADMDALLGELESLTTATAVEAATYQKAAESAQAQALLQLRRASSRASSLSALLDEVSELLPALDVEAFYLARFDRVDPNLAHLLLANEHGRRMPLRAGGLTFDPKTLVPTSLRRRSEATTSVAQPLIHAGQRLGFVVMRGRLYDAHLLGDVCQVISTALARLDPTG